MRDFPSGSVITNVIWLNRGKLLSLAERLTTLIPAGLGATLGWLCSTLLFIRGVRDEIATVLIALTVFYGVTRWGLRKWEEIRLPLLLAVFGGGIFGAMLCPAVSCQLNYENATLFWYLSTSGPVDVVISSLLAGLFFTGIMLFLIPSDRPISPDNKAMDTKPRRGQN